MKSPRINFLSLMRHLLATRFLIAAAAACFSLALILPSQGRAQILPTLPSCGFEGGRQCTVLDWEFYQNQNKLNGRGAPCDRALIPSITDNTCVNFSREAVSVDPWTDWALRNQGNLAIDEPLNWVSRLGNHNAYNTVADGYIYANQFMSMTDQLRLGSRHFQLDLHWFDGHLRLCHGAEETVLGVRVPLGCSPIDRLYAYGIKEIADWLDANPGEVMTIDFEDYSDYAGSDCHFIGNHDTYVDDPLIAYLGYGGSKILTPAEWPIGTGIGEHLRLPTKREMLALGKQIIFTVSSGCVTSNTHGGWVFSNFLYPYMSGVLLYPNASGVPNVDFDPDNRHCATGTASHVLDKIDNHPYGFDVFDQFDLAAYSTSWIAEERAFTLPNMWIREGDVERAVHCRVSVEYLDDVIPPNLPPNDHRHQAAVWSWLEGDSGNHGNAALLLHTLQGPFQPWKRWVSINATDVHPFMCSSPRSESGGPPESWSDGYSVWKVTSGSGTWFEGGQRCLAEFGPDYVFSVPVNGYQNVQASLLNDVAGDAWINYNDIKSKGSWVINHRPIAVAGPNQTVECNAFGTGTVTVNGSSSHDPDGDSLTYAWTGVLQSATGPVATIRAPMGVSKITLVVDDGYSGVGSDAMQVTVRDTTPPVIHSAAANPNSSWPPNHKMFPVRLSVDASDTCDPSPRCRVVSVTSNEGTAADWEIVGPLEVMLRSERSGKGAGRVYTILIQCTDASGNASTRGVTVTIAHDQGKSNP